MQNNRFEVKEKNSVHMNYSNGQQQKIGMYKEIVQACECHLAITHWDFQSGFFLSLSLSSLSSGRERRWDGISKKLDWQVENYQLTGDYIASSSSSRSLAYI